MKCSVFLWLSYIIQIIYSCLISDLDIKSFNYMYINCIDKIVLFPIFFAGNEKNHIKPKNFILTSQILCDNISI